MNIACLTGRLATDLEQKNVNDKVLHCFRIASGTGERTLFLPVEIWNQPHLGESLLKGSRVAVTGSLKLDAWQSKEGERRERVVLVGHHVDFLDPRPRPAGEAVTSGGAAPVEEETEPATPSRPARGGSWGGRAARPRS